METSFPRNFLCKREIVGNDVCLVSEYRGERSEGERKVIIEGV